MLVIALLLIGLAIWSFGVILMVIGGLPIIFMAGKFIIEGIIGIAIYKTVKKKIQEQQQHDINRMKGLM